MIQPMTREELIEMAKQTRKTNPRPLISRVEPDRCLGQPYLWRKPAGCDHCLFRAD